MEKYLFTAIDEGKVVLPVKEESKVIVKAKAEEKVIIRTNDGASVPSYSGEYYIIPDVEDQYLGTRGRKLSADVHVAKIPYYETWNDAGGVTVSIAS